MEKPELPKSLTDTIADWLVDQMIEGQLKPGDQLNIDEMSRRFGVSQTPIREALRSLQAEGLVEYDFHKSPKVAPLTRKTVRDLYVCRAHLLGLAGRLATANMSPDHLAELRLLVERMNEAATNHNTHEYIDLSTEFNEKVTAISDNHVLMDLLRLLHRRSLPLRYMSIAKPERIRAGLRFHWQLLDAFAARDAERVEQLIKNHLIRVPEAILEIYNGNDLVGSN